jgi:hypothetical protein
VRRQHRSALEYLAVALDEIAFDLATPHSAERYANSFAAVELRGVAKAVLGVATLCIGANVEDTLHEFLSSFASR